MQLSEAFVERLRDCQRSINQSERDLFNLVREIRQVGYSWASIGEAMGITRQAAWDRFHSYVEAADEEVKESPREG